MTHTDNKCYLFHTTNRKVVTRKHHQNYFHRYEGDLSHVYKWLCSHHQLNRIIPITHRLCPLSITLDCVTLKKVVYRVMLRGESCNESRSWCNVLCDCWVKAFITYVSCRPEEICQLDSPPHIGINNQQYSAFYTMEMGHDRVGFIMPRMAAKSRHVIIIIIIIVAIIIVIVIIIIIINNNNDDDDDDNNDNTNNNVIVTWRLHFSAKSPHVISSTCVLKYSSYTFYKITNCCFATFNESKTKINTELNIWRAVNVTRSCKWDCLMHGRSWILCKWRFSSLATLSFVMLDGSRECSGIKI